MDGNASKTLWQGFHNPSNFPQAPKLAPTGLDKMYCFSIKKKKKNVEKLKMMLFWKMKYEQFVERVYVTSSNPKI